MSDLAPVPGHVPAELVVDFDYYNFAAEDDDLHLSWKRLHDGPDLIWTPRNGGHWIATRAEDIETIFTDAERFTSTRGMSIPLKPKAFAFPPVEYDPPEHSDYRRLMAPYFTPRAIGNLDAAVRELSIDLIEGFRARGECEFYAEFALKMPIGIFLSLVDLPASDRAVLLPLADTVVRSPDMHAVEDAFVKTWGYLAEKFAERAANPGKDLISGLTQAEIDGRRLTQQELLGFGSVALFGGLDTVAATLTFVANFLATHPEHRRQLIDDPTLIPNATQELLRRFSVANLARTAARDHVYKGVVMKDGDPILVPSVLGNLDERRFADPLTVDFHRERVVNHLTFGAGAHRCVGNIIARTELRIFLEEWLQRIPDFAITPGRQPRARGGSVMAIVELPLSWLPR
jgi:cytochrome P450